MNKFRHLAWFTPLLPYSSDALAWGLYTLSILRSNWCGRFRLPISVFAVPCAHFRVE